MKPQSNDRGRVKVRYMEIDVEGGSSAILEGLRTLTAAFSKETAKTVNGHTQTRILASTTQPKPISAKNGDLFEEIVAPEEVEAADSVEEPSEADEATLKPKRKPSYPNCEVIQGLDVEQGTPNLRAFAEPKQPDTDLERYMVCAAWLKKELGLKSLTINHFYTCFTALKWKVPKDAGSPLRKMKGKYFLQNPAGEWELHSIGEQLVARLPQRD